MEKTPLEGWVEGVRSAMAVPPLSRSKKKQPGADPKWAIGDALLAAPETERDAVAEAVGLEKNLARSYWRTSEAWPPGTRTVSASWTVYRELAKSEDRFAIIQPGMTMRQATFAMTGKEIDRRSIHSSSDDEIIADFAKIMLGPRNKTVFPRLFEILNTTKDGRMMARDSKSTAILRRLRKEIKEARAEVRRLQETGSPRARYANAMQNLIEAMTHVEHVTLMFNHPEDREAVDAEDWEATAKRLNELREHAEQVANKINAELGIIDLEAIEDVFWDPKELGMGDDDIADAEVVDTD